MIYQQPPKPSRLINSTNNNNTVDTKRSPPNLQHIQVIYDSSGNTTDQVIYHSQSQQHPVPERENTSTPSRRHLLEEKRSIDAKVTYS